MRNTSLTYGALRYTSIKLRVGPMCSNIPVMHSDLAVEQRTGSSAEMQAVFYKCGSIVVRKHWRAVKHTFVCLVSARCTLEFDLLAQSSHSAALVC